MTPKPAPTRIEAAQQRADGAKKVAAISAAVAFAAVVLLARVSHPAHASSSPASGSTSQSSTDDFGFGSGSVAPSTATPDAQSTVS